MPRKNTTMDRSRQRKAKNHPTRPNKSGKIYGTPLKLMKVRRPNWMMSFRLILHKYFFHTIIANGVSRNWMITKGDSCQAQFLDVMGGGQSIWDKRNTEAKFQHTNTVNIYQYIFCQQRIRNAKEKITDALHDRLFVQNYACQKHGAVQEENVSGRVHFSGNYFIADWNQQKRKVL